jgi:hypothetical protein
MKISQRVVADRLDWVQRMLEEIRALPLDNQDSLKANPDKIDTTL